MINTQALANAIHAAYKADGGPVRIHATDPRLTCVEGQAHYFATVGGYDYDDETTGEACTFYDAPGAARIYS